MKEYWVNVYKTPWLINGQFIANLNNPHLSLNSAIKVSSCNFVKCLYRIHVKMDGGYKKYLKKHPIQSLEDARTVEDLKDWINA